MHRLLGSLLEELVAAAHCSLDTLCMALSLASRFKTFRSAPRTSSSSSASSSVFRLSHRPSRTSRHNNKRRETREERREKRGGKSERQRSRQSAKPELNQSPLRLLPLLLQGLSFLVPLPLLTASCSPSLSLTQIYISLLTQRDEPRDLSRWRQSKRRKGTLRLLLG